MRTLAEFERELESQDVFVSEGSGSKYSSEQLEQRLEKAIREIEAGEKTPQETVRYFPRGKVREAYVDMLKTEWFDLASERLGYKPAGDYMKHTSSGNALPYQGYKLRVTATPQEGREVADAVLEPLRKMGEIHKIAKDVEHHQKHQGGSQEGKFITIYPEVSEEGVIKNGSQMFKKVRGQDEPPALNRASVNSNYESTRAVLQNLINALEQSSVPLNGGSVPPTDVRYGDTRISYRYGRVAKGKRASYLDGSSAGKNKLIDVNGNAVEDNRSSSGRDNWRSLEGRKPLQ